MFIISGTKGAQKPIGWVADYCDNCLEVRQFEIFAYGIGRHVYFVSTGLTETRGHLKKCGTCHLKSATDLSRYQKVVRKASKSLDDLIAETFPTLLTTEGRIGIGKTLQVEAGRLTPQEKQDRMIQVLQRFNPLVEHRYANWSDFDKYSSSGCLTTILLFVLCINRGCAHMDIKSNDEFAGWIHAAGYTLLVGFLITLFLAIFGPSRFMKHEIVPGVAHGVFYLNPSHEELKKALDRSRALRLKIGRKISIAALDKALKAINV